MTRLIEFVIALALVLALFLVIGLILPSSRELQESVETNRRMTIVFDTLNNVRRLKDWNPLVPSAANELSYSGGEDNTGVGAKVDFNSANPAWGQASWYTCPLTVAVNSSAVALCWAYSRNSGSRTAQNSASAATSRVAHAA